MNIASALRGSELGSLQNDFVIAEWEDEGGTFDSPRYIAPLHLHHHDDEAWYVLEGKLCVRIAHEVIEVPAGSGVLAPKGLPHTYWNPGPGPARYLLVMTPNTRKLIDEIHTLSDRSFESLARLFERYGCELLRENG